MCISAWSSDVCSSDLDAEQVHYLRAFFLLFRRPAFLPKPGDPDGRSFHAIAMAEGRNWESKVYHDLGERVLDELFPRLAAAIARHDTQNERPLSRQAMDDIHHSAPIGLYRLPCLLSHKALALIPTKHNPDNPPSMRHYS